MGDYLNRNYVSAFQRVATFQVNGRLKLGGNVASYFCTPDGLVLHCIAGPTDPRTFLREASWANDTYQHALLDNQKTESELRAYFRKVHLERLRDEQRVNVPADRLPKEGAIAPDALGQVLNQNRHLGLANEGKVHLLLAVAPLPRMDQVYRVVFENILNEQVTNRPVVGR